MQALYAEQLQGEDGYHAYMASLRGSIANAQPVAPREVYSARQIYGGDIYVKGAWVLHTLRFLIGEDRLRTALRRMAYPDPALERVTDGRQCRFATTDDFLHLVEEITGMDLDWFFEVYLRQPGLPRLVTQRRGNVLDLAWQTPRDLPFPMPVEVQLGEAVQQVEMAGGHGDLTVPEGVEPLVDPRNWILREGN
jgi:aminopeptidase N